jgi:hypothetical protein
LDRILVRAGFTSTQVTRSVNAGRNEAGSPVRRGEVAHYSALFSEANESMRSWMLWVHSELETLV